MATKTVNTSRASLSPFGASGSEGAHPALRPRYGAADDRDLTDDLRQGLQDTGSLSVLIFRPSSEGHVEEVWGWEAYDDLLLDFVRRLKAFQTDGIVPAGHLLPALRALGRDHPDRRIPEGTSMMDGPTALEQKAAELDQLIRGYLAERADVSAASAPSSGAGRILLDPKYRLERLIYRGIQEARDQVTRKTVAPGDPGRRAAPGRHLAPRHLARCSSRSSTSPPGR